MIDLKNAKPETINSKPSLAYSGDTPVTGVERWRDVPVLIHEATFLGGEADTKLEAHGNRHSTLYEVMEMASQLNIEALVLGHFSSRYSANQIEDKIKELCKKFSIKIPVYSVLPGEIVRDILHKEPVNKGFVPL